MYRPLLFSGEPVQDILNPEPDIPWSASPASADGGSDRKERPMRESPYHDNKVSREREVYYHLS